MHQAIRILALMLALPHFAAAAELTSPAVRKADLNVIITHLRGTLVDDLKEGPVTLAILLDQGELFLKHNQGKALARAWEETFAGGTALPGSLRVLVTAAGETRPTPLGEFSVEDALLTREALEMKTAPYSDIPNLMGNLRTVAKGISGASGAKHIVVYSIDWVDAEQDIELTRKALRSAGVTLHVIGRTAYLSDSYWVASPPMSSSVRKEKMSLQGQEAAFRETPAGWLFDNSGAGAQPASGFGPYGFSRLAASTGGNYYLYFPPIDTPSFCKSSKCILCDGEHRSCETYYNPSFLKLLAPDYRTRGASRDLALADPLIKATLKAWDVIEDAECLQTRPPLKPSGSPTANGQSGRFRSALLKSTTCNSRIRWVDRSEKKLVKAIRTLETAIGDFEGDTTTSSTSRRAIANAHLVQAQLAALLFNMDQFRLFNLAVDAEFKSDDKPQLPASQIVPGDAQNCCTRQYGVANMHFCHGSTPIKEVEWLEGPKSLALFDRMIKLIERNIDKYHHTPWEIANRHIALAIFSLPPPST